MAQTIYVNDYRKQKNRKTNIVQILSLFQLLCLVGAFFTKGLTLIPMVIIIIIVGQIRKKEDRLFKEIVRTEETKDALIDLDDTYTVLHDIELKVGKHTLHLNHVVVGDNGVFVLKTKEWKTLRVTGSPEDKEWVLEDRGYTRKEQNPIRQVKTQVHHFSEFLKEHGIPVWVQGIVYLSNRIAYYDIDLVSINKSSDVPVFATIRSGEVHLYDYITNYKSKKKVSKEKQQQIVNLIKKYGS